MEPNGRRKLGQQTGAASWGSLTPSVSDFLRGVLISRDAQMVLVDSAISLDMVYGSAIKKNYLTQANGRRLIRSFSDSWL